MNYIRRFSRYEVIEIIFDKKSTLINEIYKVLSTHKKIIKGIGELKHACD